MKSRTMQNSLKSSAVMAGILMLLSLGFYSGETDKNALITELWSVFIFRSDGLLVLKHDNFSKIPASIELMNRCDCRSRNY